MFENLPAEAFSRGSVIGWGFSVLTFLLCRYLVNHWNTQSEKRGRPGAKVKLVPRGRMQLEPQLNIEWNNIEPAKFRPFKPQYAMTMALEKADFQEWLLLENTYDRMTTHRSEIAKNHSQDVNLVVDDPRTTAAVYELYDTVVGYMFTKWPQYFSRDGKNVKNLIKNTTFPANAERSKQSPKRLLEYLAENVEEDFIVLEYDENEEEYIAKAATFIAPSGFVPAEKVGIKLSDIHGPVPKYDEKLKLSMNRFFRRIETGQLVKRFNWTIQNSDKIYLPKGSHAGAAEKVERLHAKDLDFDHTVHFRVERQTLSRLPKSRFLVFTIRTYLTPLSQLKKEGLGERLVEAIHGLPSYIKQYKRADAWGPAVEEYMAMP